MAPGSVGLRSGSVRHGSVGISQLVGLCRALSGSVGLRSGSVRHGSVGLSRAQLGSSVGGGLDMRISITNPEFSEVGSPQQTVKVYHFNVL